MGDETLNRRRFSGGPDDPADPSRGAPAAVVKVYNNGAIPTALPGYFAAHPVTVGGAEMEGTAPTLTAAAASVTVLVVGSVVPAAGDYLLARLVGPRWVADSNGGLAGPTCLLRITVKSCSGTWGTDQTTVEFTQAGVVVATVSGGTVVEANVPVGVATTATVNPLRPHSSASSTVSFAAGVVVAGATLTGTIDLTVAAGYTCICYGPLPDAGLKITDSYFAQTYNLTKINAFGWQATGVTGTTIASDDGMGTSHPATTVNLTYNFFISSVIPGVLQCFLSVHGSGGSFPDNISGGSTHAVGYVSIDPPNVVGGTDNLSIYRDAANVPRGSSLTVHL